MKGRTDEVVVTVGKPGAQVNLSPLRRDVNRPKGGFPWHPPLLAFRDAGAYGGWLGPHRPHQFNSDAALGRMMKLGRREYLPARILAL